MLLKHRLALVAMTTLAVSSAHSAPAKRKPAQAVEPAQQTAPLDTIDPLEVGDEPPPPPEYPYPGADVDPSISQRPRNVPPPARERTARAPAPPAENPAQNPDLQRPIRVDEDGNYIYDTKPKPTTFSGRPGVVAPIGANDDGGFVYDATPKKEKRVGQPDIEAPVAISAEGVYQYKLPTTVSTRAASFRVGVLTPPTIQNPDNKLKFSDIYGGGPAPILYGDYEWPLFKSPVGAMSLKFGSGLMVATGAGHFKDPKRAGEKPEESFIFLMFPNMLSANYKFQFSRKQVFVPFVEGGGGYFTFAEIRDDGKRPKIGGSPVLSAAGGFNFLLDWLDPTSVRQLQYEYGINHVWLSVEVRANVGVHPDLDFTSNSANMGFITEF